MKPVILTCSTLQEHVAAAQTRQKTDYDVIVPDRKYHNEPTSMKHIIMQTLDALPPAVDTVLCAMDFCGEN